MNRTFQLAVAGIFVVGCRVETLPAENTFELLGLHAELGCADCHDPAEPLGPLPTDCASCHLEDSPPGHFEPPCEACHDEFGWDAAVDHSFFPLENAHQLNCESCHDNGGFEGLDSACASCHEVDRPANHYPGQDCSSCHTPTVWESGVDHTFFPLDLAHALDCIDCHTALPDFTGLQPSCTTCHAPDRPDPSHYLPFECSDCHERTVWSALPDHSFFGLTGNHEQSCDTCHTAIPDFTGLDGSCADCHEADRPAADHFPGQDCAQCHNALGWDTGVDHTFFPLDGSHSIDCAECHTAIPIYTGLSQTCESCHEGDRPDPGHYTDFDCGTCHERTTWDAGTDHSFFPLLGNHDLGCETCHTAIPDFTGLDGQCASCHEGDRPDIDHFAGQDCSNCHDTTGWDTAVDHSFFPLDNSHGVSCESCHTAIPIYTGLVQACSSCHSGDRPDPGHYTPFECDACHQNTSWSDTPDHSFFPLASSHDQSCDTCHTTIPVFTGLDEACASCHEGERPANHFVGQDCGDCHSVGDWTDAADHDFFPLTDNHALTCTDCHVNAPVYTGLDQNCNSCHEPDRPGCHFTGQTCADCHAIAGSWLGNAQGINHNQLFNISVPHEEDAEQCSDCHETPNSQCDYNCLDCHDDAPGDHDDVNDFQNNSVACFDCHY